MFARRLTLGHVFYLSLAALTLLLGVLFYLVLDSSRRSILGSAETLRDTASRNVVALVRGFLDQAERPLAETEAAIKHGAVRPDDPAALEAVLFSRVLANPNLAEVTLTHATRLGEDASGRIRLARDDRWQLSVFRVLEREGSRLVSRRTGIEQGRFVTDVRDRSAAVSEEPWRSAERGAGLLDVPWTRTKEAVPDPTDHPTFQTTTSQSHYGETLWSDLHFSELDANLPEQRRRVEVTVMRALEDRDGRFVGVMRVGMLTRQLDQVTRFKVNEDDPSDPHRVFLCDERGRLVTRLLPSDPLRELGDDLRVVPERMPPEVALALAHPALQTMRPGHLLASGALVSNGRRFLVTFRGLPRTQGWRVVIMVPEDYYLGSLLAARTELLEAALLIMAVIVLGGTLTLRAVRRALARIEGGAAQMRGFRFGASTVETPFRDVRETMESLERAKTAMRAMSKYVPVDLVRELYEANREPVLGGAVQELSLMFTDIKDFTTLSERLSPDVLAQLLGRYLEAMTAAIHRTGGTVDKYIGDAVMVMWNAPQPCPNSAEMACRSALACLAATRELFGSLAWDGQPPLITRFGLHKDRVMVGHFGAPDRMSFTALGDGVNLASRLEALNKQYGTTVIASEAIYEQTKGLFEFRRLDRVAVKGKSKGTLVYELLGEMGAAGPRLAVALEYERALDAYFARDFAGALAILEMLTDDEPSRVLAERCRHFLTEPPAADWEGIFFSKAK